MIRTQVFLSNFKTTPDQGFGFFETILRMTDHSKRVVCLTDTQGIGAFGLLGFQEPSFCQSLGFGKLPSLKQSLQLSSDSIVATGY